MKWECKLNSGDCLKEVDTENGDYLCGECKGCNKCCRCNEPTSYCKIHNLKYDDQVCPQCLVLEEQLEKENEWEKKTTELREKQLA